MNYIIPFLINLALLSFFLLLVVILGNSFIYILKKYRLFSSRSLMEEFIISFGIGLSFYVILSYIIELIFRYNFFSIYLPIFIYDFFYLVFICKKDMVIYYYKKVRKISIDYKQFLLITLFSFLAIMQFINIWGILTKFPALVSIDTYNWASNSIYLLDNQHLNYEWLDYLYPNGFSFFCTGSFLIYPDKFLVYSFIKFGSIYFLVAILVFFYFISIRIFEGNRILICLLMLILLSYDYFMYRLILFLPSVIATILFLVCVLILISNCSNYIISFILPGIYLIHNLSFFLVLPFILLIYLNRIAKSIKNQNKTFLILIKEIIVTLFLTIIFLIPYLIHSILIWKISLIDFVKNFMDKFLRFLDFNTGNRNLLYIYGSYKLNSADPTNILMEILNYEILYDLFFIKTISFFLLFGFLGLFIFNKDKKEVNKYLILKLSLVWVLIIYYFPFLFNIKFLVNSKNYNWLRFRVLEIFAPLLVLLVGIFLKYVITVSKILSNNKFLNSSIKRLKRFSFKKILIITLSISTSMYYFDNQRISHNYYFYYLPNISFFFYDNVPVNSTIAAPDFNSNNTNRVYRLFYNYDLLLYNKSTTQTYKSTEEFCKKNNIEYFILDINQVDSNFIKEIKNSEIFKQVYQIGDRKFRRYKIFFFYMDQNG